MRVRFLHAFVADRDKVLPLLSAGVPPTAEGKGGSLPVPVAEA